METSASGSSPEKKNTVSSSEFQDRFDYTLIGEFVTVLLHKQVLIILINYM